MRHRWFILLAGMLIAGNAWAQASVGAQSSASSQTDISARADKGKAQTAASTNGSSSASASAKSGQNSAKLSQGTAFNAVLSHSLDARHNKPGDQVIAKTAQDVKSDGRVVVPKGSKLVGHVTEAKARNKGESESHLGVVFDRAILKNGREVPMHAVIQTLAAAEANSMLSSGDDDMMAPMQPMAPVTSGGSVVTSGSGRASSSGGGLLGGVSSTAGATVNGATSAAGNVGQTVGGAVNSTVNGATSPTVRNSSLNANGLLGSNSSGAIGLKGLTLNSQAMNASQGSMIVSSTRNVHLDRGTRMLLRAEGQAQ